MACKYCGYDIDVHSFLTFRCPGDDLLETKRSEDRIFLDTTYSEIEFTNEQIDFMRTGLECNMSFPDNVEILK